jgi:hypothetical protein
MKWGVPEGARNPEDGTLVHDDLLISAALCAVLDKMDWSVSGSATLIQREDPLSEIDKGGF